MKTAGLKIAMKQSINNKISKPALLYILVWVEMLLDKTFLKKHWQHGIKNLQNFMKSNLAILLLTNYPTKEVTEEHASKWVK